MQNIGIIGCGRIAQTRHIPEYLENENARIVGYYDLNRERAEYDQKPVISGEDVLAAMRAVFASIQSSPEDRTIHIPENELTPEEKEVFGKIHDNLIRQTSMNVPDPA